MAEPRKITEIWAWVVTEADGGEGLPGWLTASGWMPLIGADRERIESLRDIASAAATGLPLKLMRFTGAEVVEVVRG